MKLKNIFLFVLLTTICFLVLCPVGQGQADQQSQETATVIQKLGDGSRVVEIGGQKYRAITAEQLWQWSELKRQYDIDHKDLALANQEIGKLRASLDAAKAEAATARIDLKISQDNVATLKSDYEAEKKLRQQAESFIPSGRVSSFFNNPIVRMANEFGKPLLQSWVTSRLRRGN
jgi:hypothetical protein